MNSMENNEIAELSPPSVGQILKTARLAQGIPLEEISKSLCINKRQLLNLEDETESFVCDVYQLGFVRLYAQYLGLETEDIVKQFKNQALYQTNPKRLTFPGPLPGRGIPNWQILGLSSLAIVAIIIGWKWMDTYDPAPYSPSEIVMKADKATNGNLELSSHKAEEPLVTPSGQAAVPEVPIQEVSMQETAKPFEVTSPDLAFLPREVILNVTEEAWIEVKDQEGHVVINKIFKPGESYKFEESGNLFLTTGNIKGTQLLSAGKNFPLNGESGEVKRDIPLNPEKWLE